MSGGGGGGSGVLDQVTNIGNSYTKFMTGYDLTTGQWSPHGSQLQPFDEGIGAVDGRNSSRAALNQAKDQFDYANKQAANLVLQQQWSKMQGDLMASNNAGAATATARALGGANFTNATPTALGPGAQNKDFLGL